ncbi:MAG: adenylate/guanylate cyclase domain-containing protein, partial [Longimicrobiales bacterium]
MDSNVRRLAAVWFADIVGYTRLSATDETTALRLVGLFQHAARTAATAHGGRLVRFMGDAALADFGSTDAAVKAAVQLQQEFAAATAATGSAGLLRIGVHVGDVVQTSDGDVFGDGVNTAARLQEAARPGQILVTQDVWRHLRPRGEFSCDSLGERQFEGITGRVWVFAVREADEAAAESTKRPPLPRAGVGRWARALQPVALYLVAAIALFELTLLLRDRLKLPALVTPLAVVLLALGLLVIGLTAWVQSRPTWERPVAQRPAWDLDLGEAVEALRRRRLPELTWARALVGGLLAFAVLFALTGGYQYLRNRPGMLAPRRALAEAGPMLAILPFEVQGEGAEVWREGMPDLLGMSLAGGVRVIDPLAVLSRWSQDAGGSSPEAGVRIGRDLDARFVLAGTARASADRLEFTASLYDVRDGRLLDVVAVQGSADSVPALADTLAARLLRAGLLPEGAEVAPLNLGRLATASLPALRAFLEGEQQFRRSRMSEARAAFAEAVSADPRFAFALYRLSLTTAWSSMPHVPRLDAHAETAVRHAEGLPERQAMLIRAHSQLARNSTAAIATLRQLTADYPDDVEGWFLLGDAYYHLGERAGVPADSFRNALRRGIALDPPFGPAYLHLIEDAVAHDDTVAAKELIAAYRQVDPGSPLLSAFDFAYALVRRASDSVSAGGPPQQQATAGNGASAADRSGYDAALRAADAARRDALGAGATSGTQLTAATTLYGRGLDAARRGRFAEAEDLLRRARVQYEEARAVAIWSARLDSASAVLEPLRRAARGSP